MHRDGLTPALLLRAYALGVFPMAESRTDPQIFWVDPRHRGILPLDRFHVSRSLARHLRKGGFEIAVNRNFAATLEKVCIDTVESGYMTKDLALLIGPDQKWLTTTGFLDKVDENLQKAMA